MLTSVFTSLDQLVWLVTMRKRGGDRHLHGSRGTQTRTGSDDAIVVRVLGGRNRVGAVLG